MFRLSRCLCPLSLLVERRKGLQECQEAQLPLTSPIDCKLVFTLFFFYNLHTTHKCQDLIWARCCCVLDCVCGQGLQLCEKRSYENDLRSVIQCCASASEGETSFGGSPARAGAQTHTERGSVPLTRECLHDLLYEALWCQISKSLHLTHTPHSLPLAFVFPSLTAVLWSWKRKELCPPDWTTMKSTACIRDDTDTSQAFNSEVAARM